MDPRMLVDALFDVAARHAGRPAIQTPEAQLDHAALARAIRDRATALSPLPAGRPFVVRAADPLNALIDALAVRLAGAVPLLCAPDAPDPAALADALTAPLPPETAWLLPTSGTTGAPRLVAVTDAQALAASLTHTRLSAASPGRAQAVTVPPWTAYGRNTWLGALLGGATVRYSPPTAPRALLSALANPAVDFGATTPPVVRALARLSPTPASSSPGAARAPLITAAAAYPTDAAAAVAERHQIAVLDRYGATEVGPIAQAREPGGPLHPAPEVRLRAVRAAPSEPERLEVSSPSVALGLVGGPPFGGVFRTADACALGPDGTLRLLGRVDRVIKRMGRQVDLAALERHVASLPGVGHARLRVAPGALDTELIALIVPSTDDAPDPRVLDAELARLAPWERPTRVELVSPSAIDPSKWSAGS